MEAVAMTYSDLGRAAVEIKNVIRDTGTPAVVCERDVLADRYVRLDKVMKECWPSTRIAYSFKTNYDVARSNVLKEMGAFAEVVSGREYALARDLGYPGPEIVFNGPYKDDRSLRRALQDGASVNINDFRELDGIDRLSIARREVTPVGIRLSNTLEFFGHSRFGFSTENGDAKRAVETINESPYLTLTGLHCHIHGDVDDETIYASAATAMAQFARDAIPDAETRLQYINMGGGFPTDTPRPYSRKKWNPKGIETYVRAISDALKFAIRPTGKGPALVVEPGRYLVEDAVKLITQVVHIARREGRQIVNTNGSISMVPLTHYRPQTIRPYDENLNPHAGPVVPTTIFGATCRENDILFDGDFPEVAVGDLLIHFCFGAYNSNLTPDFIFAAPETKLI